MATETFEIRIVTRGTGRSKRQIEGVGKSAKGSLKILGQLRAALVLFASIRILRGLVDLADTFVNLENRLQSSLGSLAAARNAQAEILAVSLETRTSLDATGDAFARLALGAGELGLSVSDMIGVTRTLNKAIILSGASAEEARNAMIQLSQGIASGALRGDELRSVLEQLPLVARIIAKEFGIPVGRLRILGEQGKLTAERIVNAFQSAAEDIDAAFARTTVTIGQSITVLETSFTFFLAQLSQSTGTAAALADAIGGLSRAMIFLGKNIDIAASVIAGLIGLSVIPLIKLFGRLTRIVPRLVGFFINFRAALTLFGVRAGIATAATAGLSAALSVLGAVLAALVIPAIFAGLTFIGLRLNEIENNAEGATQAITDLLDILEATGEEITTLTKERSLGVVIKELGTLKADLETLKLQKGLIGGEGFFGFLATDEQISNNIKQAKVLDELFNKFLGITPTDVGAIFSPQAQKIINALKLQLAVLELNTNGLRANNVEQEIFKNQKKAGTDATKDAGKAIDILTRKINTATIAQKAQDDLFAIAAAKAIQQDKERLAAKTRAAAVIRQLDAEALVILNQNLSLDQKRENITSRLALQRERLIAMGADVVKVESAITKATQRQTDALLRQHAAQQKVLTDDERRLLELTGETSAAAGLERGFLKMRIDAADTSKFVEEAFTATFSKMGDALAEFATTGKFNFREFANSMLQDLNRIIAKAFLSNLFSGASGGSFNFGGILARLFAGGGTVPTGGGGGSPIGFAHGGSFTVGGSGGADSQLVPLALTPGERVTITPKGERESRGGGVVVQMTIVTPDANSFRQSQTQIIAEAATLLQRANRRNG